MPTLTDGSFFSTETNQTTNYKNSIYVTKSKKNKSKTNEYYINK